MSLIWKPIADYEGKYEVSSMGEVRSLDRVNHCRESETRKVSDFFQMLSGKTLKQTMCGGGYLGISLKSHGKGKTAHIHRLVAKAFIPNPEELPQVNHIDGNRLNNRSENLEWCTHTQNMEHAVKHNLMAHNRGEAAGGAKLKEEDVFHIRKLLKQGLSQRKIATLVGVAQKTIGCINTREHWGHI